MDERCDDEIPRFYGDIATAKMRDNDHLKPTVSFPVDPGERDESADGQLDVPQTIGRYRIERVLGKGGFGLVYLGHDDRLQRLVAIKVPHAWLVCKPEDAEAYLTEARTVANLDHPHIVPVYDVGSTDEFPATSCRSMSKERISRPG